MISKLYCSIENGMGVPSENLLPFYGSAKYFGVILDAASSDAYLKRLLEEIPWERDSVTLFGKTMQTKRKVAWFGTRSFTYTYSHSTKKALIWTPVLKEIKSKTEAITGEAFNSCLLNLYHDGSEGMGWHNDGEKELKPNGTIASLSFGAERKFSLKHKKTGHRVDCLLEHGSLLTMEGETQKHWVHRLPPTKKVHTPRVNLTFRTIIS